MTARLQRICRLLLLTALLPLAALAGERPRINYLLHCSGCHQPDGSGSAENGIPNMKDRVGPVSYTHLDVYKRQGESTYTKEPTT